MQTSADSIRNDVDNNDVFCVLEAGVGGSGVNYVDWRRAKFQFCHVLNSCKSKSNKLLRCDHDG